MRSSRFNAIFNKLSEAEDRFLESEFLAPRVPGGEVRVRIAGVACTLRVTPDEAEGWGVFRPASHTEAVFVREAGLAEQRRYLALFPLVRLILCSREQGQRPAAPGQWLAAPAHQGDGRFKIEGLVPVRLAGEAQQFDVIRARFDGANFWFEGLDPASDPAAAAYLRQQLQARIEPNLLDRPGLTPEQRAAYAVNGFLREEAAPRRDNRRRKQHKQQTIDDAEDKLREALEHAGAELVDYLERNDSYRVTFSVGGRRHVSAVAKDDLQVQVAGICLSGQDRQFDLASLVGVIREAEGTGEIVRVGPEHP
jgi:hypothetical protein